jgi:uncharacterized protein YdeI (BOF family)
MLAPLCALTTGLLAGTAAAQNEDYSTQILPQSIEQLRSVSREGDYVTVEGRVLRAKPADNLYMIEDDTGTIIVKIPNHIVRDTGKPARQETIRVSGVYGHKTFVDVRSIKPSSDGSEWGIRVRQLDRKLAGSGSNPNPDTAGDGDVSTSEARKASRESAPAALDSNVRSPKLKSEAKQRMADARKRVLELKRETAEAEAAYARGLHTQMGPDELAYLEAKLEASEQELAEARAAIGPLAEEARESGVDERTIRLYEAGISR